MLRLQHRLWTLNRHWAEDSKLQHTFVTTNAIYFTSDREESGVLITDAILDQARNDLARRSNALNEVQFEDLVRLDFSFAEIRAGFGRGAVSARIRPLLGEGIDFAAIYRLTVNNQAGANRLRNAFAGYEPQDGHV